MGSPPLTDGLIAHPRADRSGSVGECPPVLVLAFNRPDTSRRVLDAVRLARPPHLYLAVDGPRPGRAEDAERVLQVQRLADAVDWNCEVHTLFRPANLGCKAAVSQAIEWFFEQVAAGIVLEDDCLPHPSFFPFAGELLQRYEGDPRIMAISGDNFQFGKSRSPYSYYFSRYNHVWGWASWRRAWKLYDHRMSRWPGLRDQGWLADFLKDPVAAAYWTQIFDETYGERNTSWAYRWTFACWSHGGLTALPTVNLVSNIGFGRQSTHTFFRGRVAEMPTQSLAFPLRHPPVIERNESADEATEKVLFSRARPVVRRLKRIASAFGIRRRAASP